MAAGCWEVGPWVSPREAVIWEEEEDTAVSLKLVMLFPSQRKTQKASPPPPRLPVSKMRIFQMSTMKF